MKNQRKLSLQEKRAVLQSEIDSLRYFFDKGNALERVLPEDREELECLLNRKEKELLKLNN